MAKGKNMSRDEQTTKCPICGKPYKVYAFSAADQSACPACVLEAEAGKYRIQTTDGCTPRDGRKKP
jgi:hypothetical protein